MSRPRPNHAPFLAFVAVIGAVTLWFQLSVAPFVASLLSLHVFFQIVLGATAVAILRNLVGLKTYGTFGAVIVAVSLLLAGPVLGFLIFAFMLLAVVLARGAISREGIQEAHRVAILVTIVALVAVGSTLAGAYLSAPGLAYAAVFPVLITAWFAERFVEDILRVGWAKSLRTLGLTTVAIVVAYVVMVQEPLVAFVARNPLSWTGLVLLNWLLGTRVKFRISERFRFRGSRPGRDDALDGGILTMNRRNRDYVDRYNPKGLLATLDKARVKALLVPQGIPMPETYLVVRGRKDLPQAAALLGGLERFAVKPASAYGGEGILLVKGRVPGGFRVNGHVESPDQVLHHIQRIVDGDFNDGMGDSAILEEHLEQDPTLNPLAPEGVLDVRVLTLLGHPVMAMARLPTKASKGRANLHTGAVGAGVDLVTGRLTSAVWNGVRVDVHPDTGVSLRGFQVPRWREVLETACAAQEASGLGFAGVDIVLDARHGPVVLEVNRRPGLEIQNANRQGLLPRLRAVESLGGSSAPVEQRVERTIGLAMRGWDLPTSSGFAPVPPVGPVPPVNGR
ncbi:MAG: hypothetical protein A3K59_04365 [Euryarchaeota archaeon RBG_19FT_COMBO_69_17]|nr:MAG: hypothetical protein A3K59_04365 [Euryarchaeota archaeon RBG_19FT_COMBO_69_17]